MIQSAPEMRAGFSRTFSRARRFLFAVAIGVGFVPSIHASRPREAAAWDLQYRTNNALVQEFGANSRNQPTSVSRSGTFTVAGNTTVAATNVTVNGSAASRYADHTCGKDGLTPTNGNNSFTVIAQDNQGRTDTNVLAASFPTTVGYTYDGNGNLTCDGVRSYAYDDENRLIRVRGNRNSWRSEFVNDGFGRRRVRLEYPVDWWNLGTQVRYVDDGNLVVPESVLSSVAAMPQPWGITWASLLRHRRRRPSQLRRSRTRSGLFHVPSNQDRPTGSPSA